MALPVRPPSALINASEEDLADRLCEMVGIGLGATAALAIPLVWIGPADPFSTAVALAGALNAGAMWRTGRARAGSRYTHVHLAVFGVVGAALYAVNDLGTFALALPGLLILVSALVHGRAVTVRMAGFLLALHALSTGIRGAILRPPAFELVLFLVIPAVLLVLMGAIVVLLVERQEARRTELHLRLLEIEAVLPAVEALAVGDLTTEVYGEGPLAEAARRTRGELAALASQLRESVTVLRSVAGVVDRTAVAQAQRTVQLANVAAELHQAQEELLGQARRVAEMSQRVAEAAAESTSATVEASERLDALSTTARRVAGEHVAIRKIATKSEVLAVNAAIEAAHAGEAGRAFSAVAARLQALAEAVREQLATAEALNEELLQAARRAGAAAERSRQATERSATAARGIAQSAAAQLRATERFEAAVAEVEASADQLRTESAEGRGHAGRVVEVAGQLATEVARFRTPDA